MVWWDPLFLKPIDGHICNYIRYIAFHPDSAIIFCNKVRVVIHTLARQDPELVETLRVVAEMQLPNMAVW